MFLPLTEKLFFCLTLYTKALIAFCFLPAYLGGSTVLITLSLLLGQITGLTLVAVLLLLEPVRDICGIGICGAVRAGVVGFCLRLGSLAGSVDPPSVKWFNWELILLLFMRQSPLSCFDNLL